MVGWKLFDAMNMAKRRASVNSSAEDDVK